MTVKVKTPKKPSNPWDYGQSTAPINPSTYDKNTGKSRPVSSKPDFFTEAVSSFVNPLGTLFGGLNRPGPTPIPEPRDNVTANSASTNFDTPAQKPPPPTPHQNTFMDYLNQAMKFLGDTGLGAQNTGADYSGEISQTQNDASDASAKLMALYNALGNNFRADAPAIGQGYDAGIADVNAANKGATQTVNDAYNQARQAQTAQLAALGIGDAAGVIAGKGESSAADQANAVSNLAQSANAVNNQLAQNRSAALDYNTKIAQAAPQEGTDKAALLQAKAAQAVQQLRMQQEQSQQTSSAQRLNELLGLAQAMQQGDPNKPLSNADQIAAMQQNLAEQKFAASQAPSTTLSPAAQANLFANIYKVTNDPKSAMDVLTQYNKATHK